LTTSKQVSLLYFYAEHTRTHTRTHTHTHTQPDELQDLAVEIDEEHSAARMPDDESGLQPRLGGLDGLAPRVLPQRLVLDQRARYFVVRPDDLLGLLCRGDVLVVLELFHRHLYPAQKLARPQNVARHGRRVANSGRRLAEILKSQCPSISPV
jgi:hypothetical protein